MALSVFFLWLLQATMLLVELKLSLSSVHCTEFVHLIRTWSGTALSLAIVVWFLPFAISFPSNYVLHLRLWRPGKNPIQTIDRLLDPSPNL